MSQDTPAGSRRRSCNGWRVWVQRPTLPACWMPQHVGARRPTSMHFSGFGTRCSSDCSNRRLKKPILGRTQVVFNNPLILAAAVSDPGESKCVDAPPTGHYIFSHKEKVVPSLVTENR